MLGTNWEPLDWTTNGLDLAVSIVGVPRGHWAAHLVEHLRSAIRAGALRTGVRLPSTRSLSADLGVSRGVVLSVYDQLKAEGYLTAEPGSGTRVAPLPTTLAPDPPPERLSPHRPNSPGLPDTALFPRRDWIRAYSAAFTSLPSADLRYGDPQGYVPLRRELADYLGRARGLAASPHQILIVNGFAQGLAILARILPTVAITTIAVEEPGSRGTRRQLQDWGLATPPVSVDGEGVIVSSLRASGADAVLVTPAHHYPTGVALSPERRRELLRWVQEEPRRIIIEDDYDAEYRYDHAPLGSLQPFNPAQIVTGSSVSKTLAPALRLGWLVLPTNLIERAIGAKAMFDLGVSIPDQAALVELLSSGAFDRHLRRTRQHYRRLRRRVAAQLRQELPECTVTGLEAGLNACLRFDIDVDDRTLAKELLGKGIRCAALGDYQQRSPSSGGLVIDLSAATAQAISTIAAAVRGHQTSAS